MRKMICFLMLSGCAAEVVDVRRPTITEVRLKDGKTKVTIENPYRDVMPVKIDCTGERDMRLYSIEPSSKVSFMLDDTDFHTCTSER